MSREEQARLLRERAHIQDLLLGSTLQLYGWNTQSNFSVRDPRTNRVHDIDGAVYEMLVQRRRWLSLMYRSLEHVEYEAKRSLFQTEVEFMGATASAWVCVECDATMDLVEQRHGTDCFIQDTVDLANEIRETITSEIIQILESAA